MPRIDQGPTPSVRLHHCRAYSNFCRCGRTIDTQLDGLGATRIVPRMDINREDYAAIDSWIDAVVGELGTLELKTAGELEGSPGAELWSEQGVAGLSGQERKKGWSRSRPFMARITAVESLCNVQNAADKDTIRIEFDLGDSGLTYIPGDAVGIWPSNDSKVVGLMSRFLVVIYAHGALCLFGVSPVVLQPVYP